MEGTQIGAVFNMREAIKRVMIVGVTPGLFGDCPIRIQNLNVTGDSRRAMNCTTTNPMVLVTFRLRISISLTDTVDLIVNYQMRVLFQPIL